MTVPIKELENLIATKEKELSITPMFLEEERNNLRMEIASYKTDLQRLAVLRE